MRERLFGVKFIAVVAASVGSWETWAPCVCPECRGVFRVRELRQANKVVCPTCQSTVFVAYKPMRYETVMLPSDVDFEAKQFREEGSSELTEKSIRSSVARRAEGMEWEYLHPKKSTSIVPKWFRLAGVALAFLLVGAILVYGWMLIVNGSDNEPTDRVVLDDPSLNDEESSESSKEPVVKTAKNLGVIEAIRIASDLVERLKQVENHSELPSLCFQNEGLEQRISDYYEENSMDFSKIRKVKKSILIRYKNGFKVKCEMEDYSSRSMFIIFIDGKVSLDWDFWVIYNEVSPVEFVENRIQESNEFRVQIRRSNYYIHDFSDDNKWQPFQIIFGKDGESVTGYCEKGSEVCDELLQVTKEEEGFQNVIVKLRYPEGNPRAKQVIIDDVLRVSWSKFLEPIE